MQPAHPTTIHTADAPAAIGPYSQAKVLGHFLFTSGQIPLIPATGEFLDGDIEAQTEQVLKNLEAILKAAGTDWERVAQTTVFMTDLAEFARMNAVYERILGKAKPARATVQVAALPKGAKIEIEMVAFV